MKCRINRNMQLKKLCVFTIDAKGNYEGYIDSVYYDAAGNSEISGIWDFPTLTLHGKVTDIAVKFWMAFLAELRKYIKTFEISANRKAALVFLKTHEDLLKIKIVAKTENEVKWAFV